MGNAFSIEPEFVVEQFTGVARGNQLAVAEELDVAASEFEQFGLLVVVGDEDDHLQGVPLTK